MAFTRINEIIAAKHLEEGGAVHTAHLRMVLEEVWKEGGVFLFPKRLVRHLRQSVRPTAVVNGTLIIETSDAQTASLILLKKRELLSLFQKRCEKLHLTALSVRAHGASVAK